MNEENLVVRSPTEARELGRKGGIVKSEAKRYASLITQSEKALCKNCPAVCVFKEGNVKKSKAHRCICPKARAVAIWHDTQVMNEEVLNKLDNLTMFRMVKLCKNPRDLKMLGDYINAKKKTDYPKPQQLQVDQRHLHFSFDDMRNLYKEVHKKSR